MRKSLCLFAAIFFVLMLMAAARDLRPVTKVKAPVISPSGGHYDLNARVQVSIRAERGAEIVYTLNGDYPAPGRGTRIDGCLASFDLPPGDVTVMAIAVMPGLPSSPAARAEFIRSGRR